MKRYTRGTQHEARVELRLFQLVRLVGAVGIEIRPSSILMDLKKTLRNRKKQLSTPGNA